MHTVARAATEHNAERLILLSTDKAVDPISIMGASKRLAELIALASDAPTMITAVRFCNVLGSSGSVAPQFVQQVRSGLEVTVTHPEATRYFLSLDQTVRLLLLAATLARPAKLLIPRVGAPVNIADLARFLIGTNRNKIIYTQLRPGDKLHESMTSFRESLGTCTDSLIAIESPGLDSRLLHDVLCRLRESLRRRDMQAALAAVREVVPEYTPAAEACIR
jgi:FlaA1/EpsC-like NDP-sugar epimerase